MLLKNDGTLPLRASTRIAIVGPLADARRVMRGNYSSAQTGPTLPNTGYSVLGGLLAGLALVGLGAALRRTRAR